MQELLDWVTVNKLPSLVAVQLPELQLSNMGLTTLHVNAVLQTLDTMSLGGGAALQ